MVEEDYCRINKYIYKYNAVVKGMNYENDFQQIMTVTPPTVP